jgi:cation diffusion facilitator CzcD-associated flavoprotein CzcO
MGERVADPVLREKLVPHDHGFGTRRPSVDGGYFETFARDNVTLADIREHPIVEFTPEGVRTDEKLYELDIVIFATGFDAITGSLLKPRIVGRGGQTLAEKWADGPLTQLGLATSGFPNMLVIGGPGSPSVLSNVMVSIEEQSDWYAGLFAAMKADDIVEIEATEAAEQSWTDYVQERAKETLYMTTNSFYNGAEVAGKPRVFMPYSGGVRHYRMLLESCAAEGYTGFQLRKSPAKADTAVAASGA